MILSTLEFFKRFFMDFHITVLISFIDNHSIVLLLRCPGIEEAPCTRNRTKTTILYLFIKISDIGSHYVIVITSHQILLKRLFDIIILSCWYHAHLIFPCARTSYKIIYCLFNVKRILVLFRYRGHLISLLSIQESSIEMINPIFF